MAERAYLMKTAAEKGITPNKFWGNGKLLKEIRAEAQRRAWNHRRELYGATGLKAN